MRIFLLGATGKTGTVFLNMALAKGHHITAYVRSPEKLTIAENLTIIQENLESIPQMSAAMRDHDVVVSCLGGNDNDQSNVIQKLTEVIVASMKESNVSRIAAISSAGIHNEFSWVTNFILTLFYKHVINDHRLAAQVIMTSGLDYTLARPLSLTDGGLTKSYRKMTIGVPKGGKNISRQDLAHFLLETIESGDYHNETVGLAY
ncbi:NAD(P)-dependent oxidoreductase [Enterococcus aquimarinus]|nr:NAD(P)-binding oxidoreductase [Enterococcus aquimarinus]